MLTGEEAEANSGSKEDHSLEREKFVAEVRFRERDFTIREAEQERLGREFQLKLDEARRSRWTSPLVIAIAGAALAAVGNIFATVLTERAQYKLQSDNNSAQLTQETVKSESDRILAAIATGDVAKATANLQMLLNAGLIRDKETATSLASYLATLGPGEGPVLPAPNGSLVGFTSRSHLQQLMQNGSILGVDVSHHDGLLDFNTLAAHGVKFVYIKAAQSTSFLDPMAKANAEHAHAAGLLVGFYYIYSGQSDPVAQLHAFESAIKGIPSDLPPAVDVVDANQTYDNINRAVFSRQLSNFLTGLQRDLGTTPIIYTGRSFAADALDERVHGYPLWIASYRDAAPGPLPGWPGYALWQLSMGVVDDPVLSSLDINAFRGTRDDLVQWAHP